MSIQYSLFVSEGYLHGVVGCDFEMVESLFSLSCLAVPVEFYKSDIVPSWNESGLFEARESEEKDFRSRYIVCPKKCTEITGSCIYITRNQVM